jgi:hypothetical protein
MKIVKLHVPHTGPMYYLEAVSTRGRRWNICLQPNDRRSGAFLEYRHPNGAIFLRQVMAPKALMVAARRAISESRAT